MVNVCVWECGVEIVVEQREELRRLMGGYTKNKRETPRRFFAQPTHKIRWVHLVALLQERA